MILEKTSSWQEGWNTQKEPRLERRWVYLAAASSLRLPDSGGEPSQRVVRLK